MTAREHCWGAGCALPPVKEHNFTTNGLQYLTDLLSTLAKRYGEGLNLKVQSITSTPEMLAPEEGGVKHLAAVVLKLKEKSDNHFGDGPIESSPDYYDYVDPVFPTEEILIPNNTGITFAHS
ncbi:hypothetical protein Ddc_13526 [Ditylenchus destructor]|nr:hypothetical protein Ddc_13526 [Ditylenchus destructor]